jgi:threonine/homoserine/homoserine lactone efflux protein
MQAGSDLWLFAALVFGVVVLPGMDMAYVAGSAVLGGLRAGTAALAGIVAGGVVHVAVAMTGVALLLQLWPAAFDALLLAGAAYMAWVGWQVWRSAVPARAPRDALDDAVDVPPMAPPAAPTAPLPVFRRALATCLLNPKAYAFSLAVFPAFVRSGERDVWEQALWLGAIVAANQVLVYGSVALAAAGAQRVLGSGRVQRWLPLVVGPLLMAAALVTPVLGWRPLS